jgi:pSer/pThr/pTyr-binding forkhead associated (FHA) protein
VRLTGDGRSFTVGLGVSPIGRGDTAVIRVDSMDLSRLHARLEVTPTEVTVEDPGSANGTMVNGETIQGRRRLENGDRVSFGLLAFRVEILRGEGSAS